jgi:hypothetical protein
LTDSVWCQQTFSPHDSPELPCMLALCEFSMHQTRSHPDADTMLQKSTCIYLKINFLLAVLKSFCVAPFWDMSGSSALKTSIL